MPVDKFELGKSYLVYRDKRTCVHIWIDGSAMLVGETNRSFAVYYPKDPAVKEIPPPRVPFDQRSFAKISGALFREKGCRSMWGMCSGFGDSGVVLPAMYLNSINQRWKELFDSFEYSMDHGETWQECSREVAP